MIIAKTPGYEDNEDMARQNNAIQEHIWPENNITSEYKENNKYTNNRIKDSKTMTPMNTPKIHENSRNSKLWTNQGLQGTHKESERRNHDSRSWKEKKNGPFPLRPPPRTRAQPHDCPRVHERRQDALIRKKTLKIRRLREVARGRRRAQRAPAVQWGAESLNRDDLSSEWIPNRFKVPVHAQASKLFSVVRIYKLMSNLPGEYAIESLNGGYHSNSYYEKVPC